MKNDNSNDSNRSRASTVHMNDGDNGKHDGITWIMKGSQRLGRYCGRQLNT